MADAFQMGEDRHAGFRLHAGDQALAAARNDDVDIAVEPAEHQPDRGAVARRYQLDRGLGQAGLAQALAERGDDGAAGAQAVRAAAQDRRIAGFQAQRAGIGGHVRPALVDDADDAERHPHPFDGHAVRPRPGFGNDANGILERTHRVDGGGDRLHPRRIERQPVEEGAGHAGGARLGDIFGIGGQNAGYLPPDGAGHELQGAVFLGGGGERQRAGGQPGQAGHLAHAGGDIPCPFNAFQRCAHPERPDKTRSGWFLSRRCGGGELGRFYGLDEGNWG